MENAEISFGAVASGFPDSHSFFAILLLYEFSSVTLKSFLALQAAKMVGFAFVRNFELRCVFV